jgi:hypothetical protein
MTRDVLAMLSTFSDLPPPRPLLLLLLLGEVSTACASGFVFLDDVRRDRDGEGERDGDRDGAEREYERERERDRDCEYTESSSEGV